LPTSGARVRLVFVAAQHMARSVCTEKDNLVNTAVLRISLRRGCTQRWLVPVFPLNQSELSMKGSQLTVFAANQSHRKNHMTVVDWILDEAKKASIHGASVLEVTEGIDAHGKYHAARFFELLDQPVAVTLAAADANVDALLDRLKHGGVRLFYIRCPIEYGALGAEEGA
jgi:PII-like signaling protein